MQLLSNRHPSITLAYDPKSNNKSTNLLTNHIDGVLDAAIRDDWEHRSINYAKSLDAVDFELAVNYTFLDALGDPSSSARIWNVSVFTISMEKERR